MSRSTAFVYTPEFLLYRFGDEHPFNPLRLEMTVDLIEQLSLISDEQRVTPRIASKEELLWVHSEPFINAVQAASIGKLIEKDSDPLYGLGTEDTPTFADMDAITRVVVGGTLTATKMVMSGQYEHALNLSGGLHHAHRSNASGFCVYNDAAVAIAYAKRTFGARVIYIDTDAHHGDGVQSIFYDDPDVLTVSFHETGKYLYPGTGDIYERGEGQGYGYAVNIPLEAYSEDESWIAALRQTLPYLVQSFKPDLIISQNGCDGHFYDPLTHLCATTRLYQEIPRIVHELAHEVCEGRWVAIGGGGYDIWRVVPRAWTLLWAEMSDQKLPDELPEKWLQRWQAIAPVTLPSRFLDAPDLFSPIPRRSIIEEKNAIMVRQALMGSPFLL